MLSHFSPSKPKSPFPWKNKQPFLPASPFFHLIVIFIAFHVTINLSKTHRIRKANHTTSWLHFPPLISYNSWDTQGASHFWECQDVSLSEVLLPRVDVNRKMCQQCNAGTKAEDSSKSSSRKSLLIMSWAKANGLGTGRDFFPLAGTFLVFIVFPLLSCQLIPVFYDYFYWANILSFTRTGFLKDEMVEGGRERMCSQQHSIWNPTAGAEGFTYSLFIFPLPGKIHFNVPCAH